MTLRALARALAIAIAVAAVVDASWQATRPVRARVGVVIADNPTMSLAASAGGTATRLEEAGRARDLIAAALAGVADIEVGAGQGQHALVVIGDRLPDEFAVPEGATVSTVSVGDTPPPAVTIEAFDVAPRLPPGGQARVRVVLRGEGVTGQTTKVTLEAGALEIGTLSHTWREGLARVELGFDLVPWAPGPLRLRAVVATGPAGGIGATAEATTYVDPARVRVLVLDAHPTWSSRFVALALSREPEIALVSRTLVGPGVTVGTDGFGSTTLSADGVDAFDVVVVSSPDAESRQVIDWLDTFMRVRGGSVVVVADDVAGLAATRRWWTLPVRERTSDTPAMIAFARGTDGWRAGVFAEPIEVPVLARVLAATREPGPRPAILSQPVGHGRLVASLALDAWRYRGDDREPFARAFRSLIVALGRESRRPLDIRPTTVAGRGSLVAVRARVLPRAGERESVPLPIVRIAPVAPGDGTVLWPAAADGVFRGRLPLGDREGVVTIEASHAGVTARAALPPDGALRAAPPLPLAWLAAAHGGAAGTSAEAAMVAASIGKQLAATQRSETITTRPMQSPWWLVPFVATLGVEWALRRRAGLR